MARAAHRQHPDRGRELRQREWALVEQRLAGRVICARCRATLATFADACTADLDDACPGFLAIDAAKAEAAREARS
jgi:hypothetical protein